MSLNSVDRVLNNTEAFENVWHTGRKAIQFIYQAITNSNTVSLIYFSDFLHAKSSQSHSCWHPLGACTAWSVCNDAQAFNSKVTAWLLMMQWATQLMGWLLCKTLLLLTAYSLSNSQRKRWHYVPSQTGHPAPLPIITHSTRLWEERRHEGMET